MLQLVASLRSQTPLLIQHKAALSNKAHPASYNLAVLLPHMLRNVCSPVTALWLAPGSLLAAMNGWDLLSSAALCPPHKYCPAHRCPRSMETDVLLKALLLESCYCTSISVLLMADSNFLQRPGMGTGWSRGQDQRLNQRVENGWPGAAHSITK